MNKNQIKSYCLSLENTFIDTPFDFKTEVVRHKENNKIFALFLIYQGKEVINLKCEPNEAEFLRSVYKDVIPGYHMNKTHWNTVYLDGDVPDEEIKSMINQSYELTKPKRKKQKCESCPSEHKKFLNIAMTDKQTLLSNLDKVHTTKLGDKRIKKNLSLISENIVEWCIEEIKDKNSKITAKGKNWYITTSDCEITINTSSYTIITAHRIKK